MGTPTNNFITILLVEDDPDFRATIRQIIEAPDVHVHEAANGLDALNIISMEHVDLVISDIHRPEMDGFKLLEMLNHLGRPAPELAFMTGFLDSQRASAIRMGALGVIQKPFSARDFLAWLHMSVNEKLKPFLARRLRFPVEFATRYGPLPNDQPLDAVVLNISQQGLLVGALQSVPQQHQVVYCTVNAGHGHILHLNGEVRWTKDLGDRRFKAAFGLDVTHSPEREIQALHKVLRMLLNPSGTGEQKTG